MEIVTDMTVKEFVEKYCKPERLHGRDNWFKNCVYSDEVIKSSQEQYDKIGKCFIDQHSSITGDIVILFKDSTLPEPKYEQLELL
ncbi:MAG: hypothetical protein PHD97_12350 [Bacteroidales bacterium]|nr:hypothetical protein [Bacteroidales bacterium]